MWIIYLSLLFLPSWLCYAQDGWLPGDEQNHFLTPSGSWEGDANLELKKEIWPLGSLQRIMWRTNMTGHAIGLVQDINPQKRWSNIVRQIATYERQRLDMLKNHSWTVETFDFNVSICSTFYLTLYEWPERLPRKNYVSTTFNIPDPSEPTPKSSPTPDSSPTPGSSHHNNNITLGLSLGLGLPLLLLSSVFVGIIIVKCRRSKKQPPPHNSDPTMVVQPSHEGETIPELFTPLNEMGKMIPKAELAAETRPAALMGRGEDVFVS